MVGCWVKVLLNSFRNPYDIKGSIDRYFNIGALDVPLLVPFFQLKEHSVRVNLSLLLYLESAVRSLYYLDVSFSRLEIFYASDNERSN